jgi:tetratricopeptide (TPR) repeat protein
MSNLG